MLSSDGHRSGLAPSQGVGCTHTSIVARLYRIGVVLFFFIFCILFWEGTEPVGNITACNLAEGILGGRGVGGAVGREKPPAAGPANSLSSPRRCYGGAGMEIQRC